MFKCQLNCPNLCETRTHKRTFFLSQVPPAASASGHKAADWKANSECGANDMQTSFGEFHQRVDLARVCYMNMCDVYNGMFEHT